MVRDEMMEGPRLENGEGFGIGGGGGWTMRWKLG